MEIAALHRFPIKSLGIEVLETVDLPAGETLPGDRQFAVTHGATKFDFDAPAWARCGNFLRLAHTPEFARITMRRPPEDPYLVTVSHPAAASLTVALDTLKGCASLAHWMGALPGARPGPYRLAEVPGRALTDVEPPYISLLTDASLTALSDHVGAAITRDRFRGNIWIAKAEPWAEERWIGQILTLGSAKVKVIEPIWRCRAPDADPTTGERPVNICDALTKLRGDSTFGVYAEVIERGTVATGDAVMCA